MVFQNLTRRGNDANEVFIKGSFDNWTAKVPLTQVQDQITQEKFFRCKLNLPVGKYEYKYIVDGDWKYDPNIAKVPDNCGGLNNQLTVSSRKMMYFSDNNLANSIKFLKGSNLTDSEQRVEVILKTDLDRLISNSGEILENKLEIPIKVSGSWDNWKNKLQLRKSGVSLGNKITYTKKMMVKPGIYQYKYILGNKWVLDPDAPIVTDESGNQNHQIEVRLIKPLDRTSKILFKNHEKASWSSVMIQDMPNMSLYGHTINLVGNKMYLFGGRRQLGSYRNNLIAVDLETGEPEYIQAEENLKAAPRAFHRSVTFGSKIIILGGIDDQNYFNDYYTFNTTNKVWSHSEIENKPPARSHFSLSLDEKENKLYMFGGQYSDKTGKEQKYYDDTYSLCLSEMEWNLIEPEHEFKPPCRVMHTSNFIDGKLYMFGGSYTTESERILYNDIWSLNLDMEDTPTWRKLNTVGEHPNPRYGHISVSLKDKIFIHGGQDEMQQSLSDVYSFNIITHNWTRVLIANSHDNPVGRYFHAAEISDEGIYILGGRAKLKSSLDNKFQLFLLSFQAL